MTKYKCRQCGKEWNTADTQAKKCECGGELEKVDDDKWTR